MGIDTLVKKVVYRCFKMVLNTALKDPNINDGDKDFIESLRRATNTTMRSDCNYDDTRD